MSLPSSPTTSRPPSPASVIGDNPPAKHFRFAFEPRKGPESISGTTDGRGNDFFTAPPGLVLLTSSTSNHGIAALPEEWSSSTHGFHAISTVLNNPHKSQAPPKAHSHLPPVPQAELPRVRRKDFDSYLRAVAPEWDRFVQNNELGRDGVPRLSPSQEPPSPRPPRQLPDLNTVPAVFLQPNFDLSDPKTFALVTEQGDEPPTDDLASLSRSSPLLEKFSTYADTVEQHLVREISQRSTSFFAALTNLHDLQSESEQCLERISQLRVLLKEVDEKSAKRGMQVVHRELKMANLDKVKQGISFVDSVVEMTGVAQNLAVAGQWNESLGLLDTLKKMWDTETQAPIAQEPSTNGRLPEVSEESEEELESESKASQISLSSLKAFSSLPEHLRILTLNIASSLSQELVGMLRTDLQSQFRNVGRSDSQRESFKQQLRPILIGLQRTNGLKDATLSWREVALAEVRSVVKQYIPAFEDTEEQDSDSSVAWAQSIVKMPHDEFVDVIKLLFQTFLRGLNGLRDVASFFVETLQDIGVKEEYVAFAEEELVDISSSAAELANVLAAKVISKRAEQHSALPFADFYTFFNEAWDFVLQCEVLCRRMIVGLRGVIVSQGKTFLQAFHQDRLNKLSKLVEDELWSPAEVSATLQHAVDIIIDAAVHNPVELSLKSPLTNGNGNGVLASPRANTSSPPPTAKHLRIEDRTYFTVSATNQVLILLQDYLQVIVNLNSLTTDTMSRMIEFLKAFNSRTCQVVLGAGAMRSAGLKNITAKHLALASQSLSIMVSLIPYIRESFRRHLSPKQAIMLVEFDKLKRDYQEHQNEIHAKLIAIMGDRLTAHIQSLQAINWEASQAGDGVNNYMQLLVKETVLLHKVLSRYLASPIVEYVMTQVFAAINHRLSEEYTKIDLPHQEAKNRLLGDAKFLHQSLSGIKNVSAQSGMLETVISEKTIAKPPPSPQVTSPLARSNTLSNANARLKGLLSGNKSATLPPPPEKPEKPLPSPSIASIFTRTSNPPGEVVPPIPTESPPPIPIVGEEKKSLENEMEVAQENGMVETTSPEAISQELPEDLEQS